jgi:hypothetical protein
MFVLKPSGAPESLPSQIARSRASECLPHMLGYGSRMEVYPLVDERMVLRVPRRTEQQLIEEFGSSGRRALAAGHEVSAFTERELRDLEAADNYIGAFLPDTTPFADLDLDGSFRYYSLQLRIRVTQDLRICTTRLRSATSRHSLERFIRDVRDMVQHVGLLPDLAGKGNLVLDRYGMVKLIDINNFRRFVHDAEVENALPTKEQELDPYILGHRPLRGILPKDFLDDLGNPICDLSLAALRTLELRGLGRDAKELGRDPFYEPLRNRRRRLVLALLRTDMA